MQVERDKPSWLLLITQLPPKPDYLRVKLRRRLLRLGSVLVKSSVYVLPNTDESLEDFAWLRREILQDGGDALICAATLVDGMTDDTLIALFRREADQLYEGIAADARSATREERSVMAMRLRRRFDAAVEVDFFGAAGRANAEIALRQLEAGTQPETGRQTEAGPSGRTGGGVWITRTGCKVDRIGSAWLIRRFIDTEAEFRFVDPKTYVHDAASGQRFDMFDGEFTHVGESCTFETLLQRFSLADPALSAIGQIVHDIDMKDARFGRAETAGVA